MPCLWGKRANVTKFRINGRPNYASSPLIIWTVVDSCGQFQNSKTEDAKFCGQLWTVVDSFKLWWFLRACSCVHARALKLRVLRLGILQLFTTVHNCSDYQGGGRVILVHFYRKNLRIFAEKLRITSYKKTQDIWLAADKLLKQNKSNILGFLVASDTKLFAKIRRFFR